MYGGVGRGKSFLMDCFFEAVTIERKTRLHFHEFMREVHRELAAMQGTVNPLDALGQKMAQRYQLICFDEFHVADITDAMMTGRFTVAAGDEQGFSLGWARVEDPAPAPTAPTHGARLRQWYSRLAPVRMAISNGQLPAARLALDRICPTII